jgi:hypothetical protein
MVEQSAPNLNDVAQIRVFRRDTMSSAEKISVPPPGTMRMISFWIRVR